MGKKKDLKRHIKDLEKIINHRDKIVKEKNDIINKKDDVISSLKFIIGELKKENIFTPLTTTTTTITTNDTCPNGEQHDFPSPWYSIEPPICKKCGQQAKRNDITYKQEMTRDVTSTYTVDFNNVNTTDAFSDIYSFNDKKK